MGEGEFAALLAAATELGQKKMEQSTDEPWQLFLCACFFKPTNIHTQFHTWHI